MNGYVPVKVGGYTGWRLESFDLEKLWDGIQGRLAAGEHFYSTEAHRKVYRLEMESGPPIFVKVQDETVKGGPVLAGLSSSMARKYFRSYASISGHGIPSPLVLFAIERRAGLRILKSVLGTEELAGHQPLPSFIESRRRAPGFEALKAALLAELARITARIHRLGLYFSLDGRNLFVHPHDGTIAVLDLDHMKKSWRGKIPLRRRERNLGRLRRSLSQIEGTAEEDFDRFLRTYESEMK